MLHTTNDPKQSGTTKTFCTREELCAYFFIAAHWFTLQLVISWARGTNAYIEWGLTLLLLLAVFLWRKPGILLGIAVIFPAYMFYLAPEVPNHRILLSLLDLGTTYFLIQSWRKQELPFTGAPFHGWHLILGVVYFYAVFAKLNSGFFQAESCAGKFFNNVTLFWLGYPLPMPPFWIALSTVTIETILLALAIYNRAQTVLVLCLGGFLLHFGLALDLQKWFLNFSSVMFWLYFGILMSFVPEKKQVSSPLPGKLIYYFLALLVLSHLSKPDYAMSYSRSTFFSVWAITFLILIYGAARLLRAYPPRPIGSERPSRIITAIACVALINGAGPYLGFKTRTSFNMYSNLQLTTTSSNHWLIPASPDIFGYLRDEVQITSSPLIAFPVGSQLTYFEFYRQFCQHTTTTQITFKRRIASHKTWLPPKTVTNCEELERPRFYTILRKLIVFRPTHAEVVKQCIW